MPYLSMSAIMNEMRNTEADAARMLDLGLKSAPLPEEKPKSKLQQAPTKASGDINASGGASSGGIAEAFSEIMSMFG